MAYVYATQTDILSQPREPGDGNVVLEVVTPGYGGRGYPFTITTRPAAHPWSLRGYILKQLQASDAPCQFLQPASLLR